MTNKIIQRSKNLLTSILDGSFFKSSVFRFILIGVFNTIHNFVWYNMFLFLKIPYQVAFTLAFIIAMTASFFLNTKFTFNTKPTLKKFIQFPVTALPNFLISQVGLFILVGLMNFEKGISGLLASLVAIPITFFVTKFILTKDDEKESSVNQVKESTDSNSPSTDTNEKWLDFSDIIVFLLLIVFSLLLHKYIFDSGFLYGDDNTDSTVQMIYFLPFLIKNFILNGNFWSWSYGMGGDIYSEFSYYYTTSPLIWSLYPVFKALPETFWTLENSLNLKLFISIYKQVLIMSFMYLLLRYEKRTKLSSFAAAIVYGGGIYYMWNSNFFDFMTDAYLWVPLMVLGFRIYEKRRNFWPLVISASLAAINNYYFAYHTFIFFIVFVLFFVSPQGKSIKDKIGAYFKRVGEYSLMGVSALLLSMFAFLPAALSFLRIDRFDTVNPVSTFYGKDFYLNMPINLFFNNSTIGIPMLIILFLFIRYRNTSDLTRRKMVFLVLFIGLYCLPFTGYFLNGMNYHSERWFYLLIFVFAYALADILDEMKKKNNFNVIFFALLLSFTLGLIYIRWDIIKTFDDRPIYIAVLIFNMVAFFVIAIRKYFKKDLHKFIIDALVVVMVFGIMVGNNFAFAGDQSLNMNKEQMEANKMESPDLKDVLDRTIPGKNEFYRTIFRNNKLENATTYYYYYGISTFSSMTDGNMHDWLKRILDIRHDIVYLSSFNNLDDRAYLEALLSVRYIVTEKGTYTPPPIYTRVYSNDLYELWENPDYVGMDMWFTEEVPKDYILNLSIPDKDMNLINYAITERDNNIKRGIPVLAEDIPLNVETMELINVDYTGDRIEFGQDSLVRFRIPNPDPNTQVYLHSYLRPEDRKEFEQKVNDKKVFKSYETNPYVYYINDWTFAMNGVERILNWTTNEKAYEIRDLYLKRVKLNDLSRAIYDRNKYNMTDLVVDNDKITGSVTNNEKGIMVFNIPYNKGWTLKDNGKKVEIQRMNGFLSGVVLEPGTHNLEFSFRSRGWYAGIAISVVTLLILILFSAYRRMYKPQWLRGNPDSIKRIYPEEPRKSVITTISSDQLYHPEDEHWFENKENNENSSEIDPTDKESSDT